MNFYTNDLVRSRLVPTEENPSHIPKYQTYESKLSILISAEQQKYLEDVVMKVMRQRTRKHERITKNSLIRCLIEFMKTLDVDLVDVADEKELLKRLFMARLNRIL